MSEGWRGGRGTSSTAPCFLWGSLFGVLLESTRRLHQFVHGRTAPEVARFKLIPTNRALAESHCRGGAGPAPSPSYRLRLGNGAGANLDGMPYLNTYWSTPTRSYLRSCRNTATMTDDERERCCAATDPGSTGGFARPERRFCWFCQGKLKQENILGVGSQL